MTNNILTCFILIVRSRRGGGGGDHWEPEERERRNNDVCLTTSILFCFILTTFPVLLPTLFYHLRSVAGGRVRRIPVLGRVLVPPDVVLLRRAGAVRGAQGLAVAPLAAVRATAIASRQRHSHVLLAGPSMRRTRRRSSLPRTASGRTACTSATSATTSNTAI